MFAVGSITTKDQQFNFLSGKKDKLIQLYKSIEKITMEQVEPLEQEQAKLSRICEILALQKEILQSYLSTANPDQNIDLSTINTAYTNAIAQLIDEMTNCYKDFIKNREQYYDGNKMVDLDAKQRERLLSQYVSSIKKEIDSYPMLNITAKTTLQDIRIFSDHLEKEIKGKVKEVGDILQHKTRLVTPWVNSRESFAMQNASFQNEIKALQQMSETSLPALCARGDLASVKALVEKQPKKTKVDFINECGMDGSNGLHQACLNGHAEIIAYLLQKEANPCWPDEQGYCPIHYAVVHSQKRTIQILNTIGVSAEARQARGPYGRTALHTAALTGNVTAAQWLIEHGATINVQEGKGSIERTPLHNAAFKGNVEMVKFLLEQKANPFQRNKGGETPLYEAIFVGHLDIAYLFFQRGIWLSKEELEQIKLHAERSPQSKRCLTEPLQNALQLFIPVSFLAATPGSTLITSEITSSDNNAIETNSTVKSALQIGMFRQQRVQSASTNIAQRQVEILTETTTAVISEHEQSTELLQETKLQETKLKLSN